MSDRIILAHIVDGEPYIFVFEGKHQAIEAMRIAYRFAEDPDLNFQMNDAGKICEAVMLSVEN